MPSLAVVALLGLVTAGCITRPGDQWSSFGAHQGDSFALSADEPNKGFRVRLCVEWADESEPGDVEFSVFANAAYDGDDDATLKLQVDMEEGSGPETFGLGSSTRVESERFLDFAEPRALCRDDVLVKFALDEAATGTVTIDWEIDFLFFDVKDFKHSNTIMIVEHDDHD